MTNQTSQIDAHDLTVYPDGINTYDQVNEFQDYENSEFISESNHNRTIQGLKKLEKYNNQEGRNDLFIVVMNESSSTEIEAQPIRQLITGLNQEKIYNFMFDYALTGITEDDKLWIEYFIRKYRFVQIDDSRTEMIWSTRKMLTQAYFGLFIDKRKIMHIQGIWS